jgi:hypothetical protein
MRAFADAGRRRQIGVCREVCGSIEKKTAFG